MQDVHWDPYGVQFAERKQECQVEQRRLIALSKRVAAETVSMNSFWYIPDDLWTTYNGVG
jgi:hypothetical protein